jgi:hypothetical protein
MVKAKVWSANICSFPMDLFAAPVACTSHGCLHQQKEALNFCAININNLAASNIVMNRSILEQQQALMEHEVLALRREHNLEAREAAVTKRKDQCARWEECH